MKRFRIGIITLALLVSTAASASANPAKISDTKHNLSFSGPGTYRASTNSPSSGGTSEICVFCHTPHGGNTDAPLWNRSSSASGYTPYASDVMSVLSLTAENPGSPASAGYAMHVKTRICLTCHDGTVAIGKLVNMPYGIPGAYSEIQMTTSKIQQQSPGYLGLDLRDDHPVAVVYDNTKDRELRLNTTGKIRLYNLDAGSKVVAKSPGGNGDYVECTSCHDPHNNQYGSFLIDSNRNSAICTSCHNKSGYEPSSIHAVSSATYSVSDGVGGSLGTTVGSPDGVKCMDCHFPHKAAGSGAPPNLMPNEAYGTYLLTFQKDASCFNNPNRWNSAVTVCHGTGATNGSGKNIDIQTLTARTNSHNYDSAYGTMHGAAEVRSTTTAGWQSGKWHVECADCHNPHTAGNTTHAQGVNTISSSSPLYGASGVVVSSWPGSWQTILNFAPFEALGVIDDASHLPASYYEYQVCIKCHSSFGGGFPSTMTDQAQEFNPSVASWGFHPVAGANYTNLGTMKAGSGWTTASQTMYCSDCHDTDLGAGTPVGPHGTNTAHILKKSFDDTSAAGFKGTYQSSSDICFDCHDYATYGTGAGSGTGFATSGGTNLHTRHYTVSTNAVSNYGYKCVNCHVRVPHGWDRRAMIIVRGEGATHGSATLYELSGGATITGLNGGTLPGSNNYNAVKTVDCFTANGCHQ